MFRSCCVAIAAVLFAPIVHGQSGEHRDRVFKSAVDLVGLTVVVTDRHGKFVRDLTVSDFEVYEDSVLQTSSLFIAESIPLDVAVLIDTSGSMSLRMDTLKKAAAGFILAVRPGDRVSIVEIKDTARTLYRLGPDVAAALNAIHATNATGNTALFNALYITLKELSRGHRTHGAVRRCAIVVFSDGEDTTSLVSFEDVVELAKRSPLATYTITLKDKAGPGTFSPGTAATRGRPQTEFAMRTLASETGGRAFFPSRMDELDGIYGAIAAELADQYVIGYTSNNPGRDGVYRRVSVRVAGRPELRVRTRLGYVAPSSSSSR